MISKLGIKNFKTLADIELNLKPLNLLTGLNGTGKSSVIQSLLLLRQSILDSSLVPGYLRLKGNLTNIGNGKDALYQFAQEETISFSLVFNNKDTLVWNTISESTLDYLKPNDNKNPNLSNELLEKSLFNRRTFTYLNVEHVSPRESYESSDFHIKSNDIGINGEYTVGYLNTYGFRRKVLPKLVHPRLKASNPLIQQVEAWLAEISPNIKISITEIPHSDELVLGYQYSTTGDTTQVFKSVNVGFGISYVLPVLVAILKAEAGDLIILENPESHLHPRGQSTIGRLIALAAADGVQIIVETHSDHILNGIRVAVKNGDIDGSSVALFFFNRMLEEREHRATVENPTISSNGRLDYWPEGFFDEWENTLDELIA